MNHPAQVAPGAIYRQHKPVRDPLYLKFIRMLPCVGCGKKTWRMEAMHTGPHGLNQKASDLDALPGCPECHRELHRIGPVKFQDKHGIDFAHFREVFNSFYQTKIKREAA